MELKKSQYLVMVAYYSRYMYIEFFKLEHTTSEVVINHMKSILARHGIPETTNSDKAIPTYFYVSHRYGSPILGGRSVGKKKGKKKKLARTFKDTKLKCIIKAQVYQELIQYLLFVKEYVN